jgi:imidazolonepropionase-like amidohydrolase
MNTLLVALLLASAERKDQILIQGIEQGSQTVAPRGPDSARAEFSFNDRGRGDHIIATWKLDAAGVPIEYSGSGNDYMKSPVTETFSLSGGKAKWHSRSEQGETAVSAESFYIPANPPPEIMSVLARALLKSPNHTLPLLPAGEAHITTVGTSGDLTLYHITGLDFSPTPVWLDHDGNAGATISGWISVVPTTRAGTVGTLTTEQTKADSAWSARLAKQLTHAPAADLLIRNARLFDPRDLSVTSGTSVLVRTGHIVRVAPDSALHASQGTQVIDAGGKFLMPGLWDNHQHFSGVDGALDLANGITSARDMANDLEDFPARVARFDAGTELGPRVFKAGIIDGTGPLAGPTRMRVDTPAEALKDVAWYADHGYGQIKIYSSVKPQLVPLIADAAHARGLRVSGHVPAFMSAQMFVDAGADEIQHMNFIVLNFLFDQVKDTRGTTRFTAVAEHAHELGPNDPKVQAFVRFLKAHHTVLDPTMSIFESMFSGDPAGPPPALEKIVPRFPAQVRRSQLSGALTMPKDKEAAYKEAFPAMLHLLKMLADAGITIVPGTDALSGYTLLHELELYARAGIPPAQVLRMATLTSAQVVGVDRERGTIAAGKLADMVLIDGDPTAHIEDIHNATLVIKGGNIYQPPQIETALGITPKEGKP